MQLENELGLKLLHRTKRRVELSDAGKTFLAHAKQIIHTTETAAVEAKRAERGEIGRLAVGFFEHMSYTLLPPTYRAYRERFPSVVVELRWFPVVGQADALRRGDVDIAFLRPVSAQEDIAQHVLVKEPLVLAVPAMHPLATRESLSVKQCAGEPFILYARHMAPDLHSMITRMFAAADVTPNVALEVGQVYTCLGLVSSGAGLAFVPSSVQRIRLDHVVYRPIRGRTPEIETMLGWKQSNPSPLLTAFVETARSVVRSLAQ